MNTLKLFLGGLLEILTYAFKRNAEVWKGFRNKNSDVVKRIKPFFRAATALLWKKNYEALGSITVNGTEIKLSIAVPYGLTCQKATTQTLLDGIRRVGRLCNKEELRVFRTEFKKFLDEEGRLVTETMSYWYGKNYPVFAYRLCVLVEDEDGILSFEEDCGRPCGDNDGLCRTRLDDSWFANTLFVFVANK